MQPALLDSSASIGDGDHVLVFNTRATTSGVLMHCLLSCDDSISYAENTKAIFDKLPFLKTMKKPSIRLTTITEYESDTDIPTMFKSPLINDTFIRLISNAGRKQLRVAEELRYTHVKVILSGTGDIQFKNEDAVMINETSITDKNSLTVSMESTVNVVKKAMKSKYYDCISTILAGAGIASSSFDLELTTTMCKEVDRLMKELYLTAQENGYTILFVGTNSECTGVPEEEDDKAPLNDVPCIICPPPGVELQKKEMACYSLENVAATCLKVMGIPPADHMEEALL